MSAQKDKSSNLTLVAKKVTRGEIVGTDHDAIYDLYKDDSGELVLRLGLVVPRDAEVELTQLRVVLKTFVIS